jgi:YD repeat-containing protein
MYYGQGSVMYSYNNLAQLTSETRTLGGPSFTLSYGYNLAGELNSITNPFGAQVGYGYDKVGRYLESLSCAAWSVALTASFRRSDPPAFCSSSADCLSAHCLWSSVLLGQVTSFGSR